MLIGPKGLEIKKEVEERLKDLSSTKKDLILYRVIFRHIYDMIGSPDGITMNISLIVYGIGMIELQLDIEKNGKTYGLRDLNETFDMIEQHDPFEFTGDATDIHEYLKSVFEKAYFGVPRAGIKRESIKELVLKRDKLQKEEDERKGK